MSFKLGITGSIATGKSTVSQYLKSRGYPVIDADEGARIVVEPGTPANQAIKKVFGSDYLHPNDTLHRERLGELIFFDNMARQQLDDLVQPHVKKWVIDQVSRLEREEYPLIVLDIPLLYEEGYEDLVDQTMVIYVPESMQLERLMARDHLIEEDAFARICSQMSIERKVDRADIVIDNTQNEIFTFQQVDAWLNMNGFE